MINSNIIKTLFATHFNVEIVHGIRVFLAFNPIETSSGKYDVGGMALGLAYELYKV